MSQGRQKAARALVVAQAAVVWGGFSETQLNTFVETGVLDGNAGEPKMDYDQDLVKAMVATGKLG